MQREGLKLEEKTSKRRINYNHIIASPYFLVLIGLVLFPMLVILLYSVLTKTTDFPIYHFTIRNYVSFFEKEAFVQALLKSLGLAFVSTLLALLIGYPIAYYISKRKPSVQASLILLISSPMLINMLLRTLAIKQIIDGPVLKFAQALGYDNNTLLGNWYTIILGMVYLYLPFMILPIYTILNKMDKRYIEASCDLGGRSFQTFRRVIFPLSLPGVLSGVSIVFLSTCTTIVITKYLGEGKYNLIGNVIETEFITNSNWSFGSAISIILIIIIMLALGLMTLVNKKYEMEEDK